MDQIGNRFNTTRRKRAAAIAMICGFLLVLPSCGMPLLRQPASAPPLPETLRGETNPTSSAQVPVEEFFDDPLLDGLIKDALVGNQELRILTEDIAIAGNEVWGRTGSYLPRVELGASAGLEKLSRFTPLGVAEEQLQYLPGKNFPDPPGNFLVAANISWQVDIWRQLRNARDSAKIRYFATGEGRNYAVTRLVADIAENYYRLMALDARLVNINRIIALQEQSLVVAMRRKNAGRGTDLPVQRFQAEVRKNQSERSIVNQSIIELENRINFLLGRFPQPVQRRNADFIDLNLHALSLGLPWELLQNRPDIRQAERELAAAGLDVKVARANFLPRVGLAGPMGPGGPYSPVGWQAFNPRYLFFTPDAFIASLAGDLVAPVINKRAIQAEYQNANARQLQSVYNYQRVIINAANEVITLAARVENYRQSIEIRKQQVESLESAVMAATNLYQLPRVELPIDYLDVLTAQNELFVAIQDLIEVKGEQLAAIVNTYQALGGGGYLLPIPPPKPPQYDHQWWKLILSDLKDQAHHWRHARHPDTHHAPGGPVPPPPPGPLIEAPPNPGATPMGGGEAEPEPPAGPAMGETPQLMPVPPAEDSDPVFTPKEATGLEPSPSPTGEPPPTEALPRAEAEDRPGPSPSVEELPQ
jgi:NodT family efflux transporter outer membrane factor (OMF) lipoprotein